MNEVIEIESIPTKIKYKGFIWVRELKKEHVKINNVNKVNTINKSNNINKKVDKNFTTPVKKRGSLKKPYLVKWIEKKDPGDVFTLNQFYRLYPKLKKDTVGHVRVDKIIINLVQEGKINHWKNKDQFRVLK